MLDRRPAHNFYNKIVSFAAEVGQFRAYCRPVYLYSNILPVPTESLPTTTTTSTTRLDPTMPPQDHRASPTRRSPYHRQPGLLVGFEDPTSSSVSATGGSSDEFSETHCHSPVKVRVVQSAPSITGDSPSSRTVRFNLQKNIAHKVPHHRDLDSEMKEAIWYSKDEYAHMKRSVIAMVRVLMRGKKIVENDRQSVRGLEFRTPDGARSRQAVKHEALAAVLNEQGRQVELQCTPHDDECSGGYDDKSAEILSRVYMAHTAPCQRAAHTLALGDVAPAQEYCRVAPAPHPDGSSGEHHHHDSNERGTVPKTPSGSLLFGGGVATVVRRTIRRVRSKEQQQRKGGRSVSPRNNRRQLLGNAA
jgi:hypothetical protein